MTTPYPTNQEHLSALLQQWCAQQGLPLMSADELVVSDSFGLAQHQRQFLEAFVDLWDACIECDAVADSAPDSGD